MTTKIKAAKAAPVVAETAEVATPAPRKNAHGIGKAWTGNTSTSRMSQDELYAYQAYLAGIAKPNARQIRHLARCNKLLNKAEGVLSVEEAGAKLANAEA